MPFSIELAFLVAVATVCALDGAALVAVAWRAPPSSPAYERKFRAFKVARVAVFAVLLVSQAALLVARAATHGAAAATTPLDAAQLLAVLLYAATLAVLAARWPRHMQLSLAGALLLALALPATLLAEDVAVAHGRAGAPPEAFDAEHIARVACHGAQLLLLLALLISEVVISQHALLGTGGSAGGAHAYAPLAGEDPEAPKMRRWRPGDGRVAMAAAAFQYVWPPAGRLRARLLACFALVLLERGINLAVPVLFKLMVEALSAGVSAGLAGLSAKATAGASGSTTTVPAFVAAAARLLLGDGGSGDGPSLTPLLGQFWALFYPWCFFYLFAFFLRGGSGAEGLLSNVRDILYIPITQAAFRRISSDVFGHLLDLDLHFHVHRKTGQIMRILDRGTSSIQDTVSIVLFNVVPQLIDIVVAVAYLAARMQPWVALIVAGTVVSYVPLTLYITERRGRVRKVMNALDNERESRATDMLLNYETVKYFTAERIELAGYDAATRRYQGAEYWQMAFVSLLAIVQGTVAWAGLAAGLLVCVAGVASGAQTVGDAVLFVSMMQQLYVPLTFFGSYYRQTQKALIDMENMFELLATVPRVQDAPHAPPIRLRDGAVEFRDVVFGYAPTPGAPGAHAVLRGVSFKAPGATTLAVVGATGSGKSTLLRLLLRFYDPWSGAVLLDGQDVRRYSQASVRGAIGVVPQDTVLFNDTVLQNIRYGRPGASDADVYAAARVAHIHDHVAAFPAGYATRVGERGLRLSGGEKQRVAFARAVLKAPKILVLDEATSALDSLTERMIQASLASLRGRVTSLIVAHRLSTVLDAEQILVMERGKVVEIGSHQQLVSAGGLYAAMWARQQDGSGGPGGGEGGGAQGARKAGGRAPASASIAEVAADEEAEQGEEEGGAGGGGDDARSEVPRVGDADAANGGGGSCARDDDEDDDDDDVHVPGSLAAAAARAHGRRGAMTPTSTGRSSAGGGDGDDGDDGGGGNTAPVR